MHTNLSLSSTFSSERSRSCSINTNLRATWLVRVFAKNIFFFGPNDEHFLQDTAGNIGLFGILAKETQQKMWISLRNAGKFTLNI